MFNENRVYGFNNIPSMDNSLWSNESFCKDAILSCPRSFMFVRDQTEELCLLAVSQDPGNIDYVDDAFKERCIDYLYMNFD